MLNHRPRKRFGQNFLRDGEVCEHILRCLDPKPGDHIVEIGPGRGALTERLVSAATRLDLIEIDRDLAAGLRDRYHRHADRVLVHEADALKFDLASLVNEKGVALRLVGNLPYNISTPLLFRCFTFSTLISDMHFMLQKEVVDRMCAPAGSKAYGRLSVMVGFFAHVQRLFDVPPSAFSPPPRVTSTVVRLMLRPTPPVACEVRDLERVVRAAFSKRRKTIRNALRGMLSESAIAGAGVDPGARAEQINLAEFAALARLADEAKDGA